LPVPLLSEVRLGDCRDVLTNFGKRALGAECRFFGARQAKDSCDPARLGPQRPQNRALEDHSKRLVVLHSEIG